MPRLLLIAVFVSTLTGCGSLGPIPFPSYVSYFYDLKFAVRDASGAPVEGAEIYAVSVATSYYSSVEKKTSVTTGADGLAHFPAVGAWEWTACIMHCVSPWRSMYWCVRKDGYQAVVGGPYGRRVPRDPVEVTLAQSTEAPGCSVPEGVRLINAAELWRR